MSLNTMFPRPFLMSLSLRSGSKGPDYQLPPYIGQSNSQGSGFATCHIPHVVDTEEMLENWFREKRLQRLIYTLALQEHGNRNLTNAWKDLTGGGLLKESSAAGAGCWSLASYHDGEGTCVFWARQGTKPPGVLKRILFKDCLPGEETQQRQSMWGWGVDCQAEVWSEIFSRRDIGIRSSNGRVLVTVS